ncbi:ubiquitin carboxyl-terminal hydrolase 12-like protein isoform X2 [Tanacetum coccineum]
MTVALQNLVDLAGFSFSVFMEAIMKGSTILLMTRLADATDADCCYYRRHKSLLLLSHLAAAVRDYVGWLCVNDTGKPIDILERLNEMVGFAPYEEIELFQEYRSGFDVQCLRVDKTLTFLAKKLRDGDIICFQKHLKVVRFRSLEKTKEDAFSLTLLKIYNYDEVLSRLARYINLDDPSKIRLTSHNCWFTKKPKREPIKYHGVGHLSDMLTLYTRGTFLN